MIGVENRRLQKGNGVLIERLRSLEERIGNTRFVKLVSLKNGYVKMESDQFGNSIKIRPAFQIIKNGIELDLINNETVIIESTSGNFGIALAMICSFLALKFVAVIDKNTPKQKADLLRIYKSEVITIEEKDECGGYLLNRIKFVEDYMRRNGPKCFHPDQYFNAGNPNSYFDGLGNEICRYFDALDAVVIAVSTGGTITGLSRKLKLHFPGIEIIAVDVQGSQVFQRLPHSRTLSGIGSSIQSAHIKDALIDKVVILSEPEIVKGCRDLLDEEMILGGASTGAAYAVVKSYQLQNPGKRTLFLCPDSGASYLESVYKDRIAAS